MAYQSQFPELWDRRSAGSPQGIMGDENVLKVIVCARHVLETWRCPIDGYIHGVSIV